MLKENGGIPSNLGGLVFLTYIPIPKLSIEREIRIKTFSDHIKSKTYLLSRKIIKCYAARGEKGN